MSAESNATWTQVTNNHLAGAEEKEYFFEKLPSLIRNVVTLNAEMYTSPAVQRLKRDEKFDLVVFGWFFNDFHVGLAAHFKCPAVIVSSTPAFKPLRDFAGVPAGIAHTPVPFLPHNEPMSFLHRTLNALFVTGETLVWKLLTMYFMEPTYRQFYPSDEYPSFDEARKSVALVMVTQHFSQEAPMLSFPSLIEVSGMHIPRVSKELPVVSCLILTKVPNNNPNRVLLYSSAHKTVD